MPYKMDNGKWRAHKMIDGKRKTKQFATKAEAKAWESSQDANAWTQAEIPVVTALEWANQYLDHCKANMTHKTYVEKTLAFRRLSDVIRLDTPAESITPQQAAIVFASASSGYAGNKLRKNLIAAWTWGTKMLGLDPSANPFKRVNRRSEVRKPRHVPSLGEMNRLLATEQGQDRVMLLLMLHTAARRGEVFRLKWDDVDLANSRIRLWTKKRQGGDMESDWLPMTQELRAAMTAHKRTAQSVYVFCQEDGQPFAYRQAYMAHACARAGVKEFGFHAIRHLTACVLDEAGLPLAEIQAVLRHKSSTTTSRYLHALRGVQVGIEKAFGGKVIEMKKAPGGPSGG